MRTYRACEVSAFSLPDAPDDIEPALRQPRQRRGGADYQVRQWAPTIHKLQNERRGRNPHRVCAEAEAPLLPPTAVHGQRERFWRVPWSERRREIDRAGDFDPANAGEGTGSERVYVITPKIKLRYS